MSHGVYLIFAIYHSRLDPRGRETSEVDDRGQLIVGLLAAGIKFQTIDDEIFLAPFSSATTRIFDSCNRCKKMNWGSYSKRLDQHCLYSSAQH